MRRARRHRGRPGAGGPTLASPDNPVTWPVPADAGRIADGLAPEQGATLRVYNWSEYIYKKVVQDFEKKYKKYDVKVQVSTYGNMDEAVAKLRAGQVAFDVLFPTYDYLGKLVQGTSCAPSTTPTSPTSSRSGRPSRTPGTTRAGTTVPYTIYSTGIAWRVDKVTDDIAKLPNPYEALWDERYRGKVGILDDYREAIGMTLLKNGITDLNTGNQDHLNLARDQLVDLAQTVRPRVNTNDYIDLPEGKTWITQAWSGDMVNAQYYMPKGQSAEVMRYWFPEDGKGPVNSDLIVLLRSGKNPVLGHLFMDHLLDYDVAVENMSWNGYQPPQNKLNPTELVSQELLPKNLETATVLPAYFESGYRYLELPGEVDDRWHAVWQEFKAGRSRWRPRRPRRRPQSPARPSRSCRTGGVRVAPPPVPASGVPAGSGVLRRPGDGLAGRAVPAAVLRGPVDRLRPVDPLFRTPVPVWNPVQWNPFQFELLYDRIFGPARSSARRSCAPSCTWPRPALCLLLAYPVAYYVTRYAGRRKGLLLVALLAPFWISYMMRMLAWVNLLESDGMVNACWSPSGCWPSRSPGWPASRSPSPSGWSTATSPTWSWPCSPG